MLNLTSSPHLVNQSSSLLYLISSLKFDFFKILIYKYMSLGKLTYYFEIKLFNANSFFRKIHVPSVTYNAKTFVYEKSI